MFHNQNQYLPRSLPSSIVEDDCFVNVNNSKHIECIIPTAEIMVTFRGNTQFQRQCYVYAEKIDLKELIVSLIGLHTGEVITNTLMHFFL